jgi:hypothetical protein
MASADVSGTQSVLDQMTDTVMKRKQEKGARLTPVGREVVSLADPLDVGQAFPFDKPQDVIAGIVNQMNKQLNALLSPEGPIEALRYQVNYLSQYVTAPVEPDRNVVKDVRPIIREGVVLTPDIEAIVEKLVTEIPTFAENFAAKAKDAQDQVFTRATKVANPDRVFQQDKNGWHCSVHGQFKQSTTRGGNPYRTCPEPACSEFERLYG